MKIKTLTVLIILIVIVYFTFPIIKTEHKFERKEHFGIVTKFENRTIVFKDYTRLTNVWVFDTRKKRLKESQKYRKPVRIQYVKKTMTFPLVSYLYIKINSVKLFDKACYKKFAFFIKLKKSPALCWRKFIRK